MALSTSCAKHLPPAQRFLRPEVAGLLGPSRLPFASLLTGLRSSPSDRQKGFHAP